MQPATQLAPSVKIGLMYNTNYLKRRKKIARLLVDMLYEGRNSKCNIAWIYDRYGQYLLGVDIDTFHSYLAADEAELSDVDVPPYIVVGLWMLVNIPMAVHDIPAMLRRRMREAEVMNGNMRP